LRIWQIVAPSLDRDARMVQQRARTVGHPEITDLCSIGHGISVRDRDPETREARPKVEVGLDLCRGKLGTGSCTPVLAAANAVAAAAAAKSATCLLVWSGMEETKRQRGQQCRRSRVLTWLALAGSIEVKEGQGQL
jgi:hypothetical protein